MLASARPTTACCRTATRVLVARPSSSSRAAEKSTASQQSSLTSKEWRVRRRVIKAAVFGNREVEERLADPSAPVAGPSSGPRSTYLEQGFRPTPSRGHAKPSVEQPKSIKDEEEALKLRHYVSRAAIQRHLRRRASSSRSFSTSATAALRDDRASTSTPTPQSLATGKHATVAAKVTPPPYPAEDLAEDELDVLDGLDDVAPEGSFDARVKGQRRHVPGSDNSNYGTLAPGCWVESRRHGFTSEGILCGRSPHNPRDVLVLSPSATGESAFLSITADDITFVLPSFAPPSLAAQCLSLPPTDPQVHALLQQLRHLEIRVEDHTRRLVSKGGKDLYRRLKPNASAFSTMTALFILGEHRNANAETHLAMHRIIIADPLHFIADPISMRTSGRFAVRSVGETQSFERVRGWVREQSEELGAFARKAAEVRAFGAKYGRKASKERWIWMEKVPDELAWSLTDVEILRFLQRTLDDERALQTHPYLAITPTIIKTVDEATLAAGGTLPYTGIDVGRHRMRAFLAELGVVAPWEDWVVHDLDNFFGVWDSVDRSMLQEATGVRPVKGAATSEGREGQGEAALSTPRRSGAVKAGYYAQDAHDSVRHDFNQLPVYTIDDAGAMELDDGISLAPAAPTSSGEPTWWVHVHVADPTALLEPAHPLARAARHRNHSEYFPEKTWSMLPEWFVQREGMSLGSQKGRVQRTLSISMRVNGKGEVLESDVKVGVVRNVKRLTYKAVDQALGGSPPAPSTVLTHPLLSLDSESSPGFVRKPRETDDSTLAADASSVADLTTLHHLANAMLQRRIAADALYWSFPQAGVSVSPRLSHRFGISPHATFPRTQPVVSLTLPNLDSTASFSPTSSPAQLLVSEMMVAANRAAARFSVEKGLPVPFRTQQAPVISAQTLQEVLACRDPRTGEASGQDILRLGVDFLPGSTKVEPGPHWPMGIKDEWGYLKVTSPLRRFSDLFAHWQIKSALLPSWAGTTAPPFTRSAVLLHIKEMDLAHKARGKLSKHAEHFWALYVLKQKMDAFSAAGADVQTDATASLLLRDNPLSALSLRDPTFSTVDGIWVQPVLVQDLGVRATLRSERQVEAPEKGEIVLVGVEDIKLGPRSRMMVRRRW